MRAAVCREKRGKPRGGEIGSLIIREAEERDLPKILQLYAGIETDPDSILDLESAKAKYRKIKKYPSYAVYVAEKNENIIGTFELLIMDNLAHYGKPSEIVEDVVVEDKHRNSGVGREMKQYAMEVCRRHGCY
jgi:N-acetylglutamate synthase-like GNAT family acetyltransferase